MPERGFLTTDARTYLKEGSMPLAIIRTSADLERILFEKLFFECKINPDLMEEWTLGRYILWCEKMNLIDTRKIGLLRVFNEFRNLAVHHRVFIERLNLDKTRLERTEKLVLKVLDFIDSTKSKYGNDQEIEKKYSIFGDKLNKKENAVFNRLDKIFRK